MMHSSSCFALRAPWLRPLGQLLGAIATLACFSGSAQAAETVILRYDETQTPISIEAIAAFVESNTLSPELQAFFNQYPDVQAEAREILGGNVVVTERFIERALEGSTGEFVLIQLQKLINSPERNAGIEALRATLIDAYRDDNQFSILELLEKYPADEVYVDMRGLDQVYSDVVAFIERIQPILETAREYLQDLVCDCEAAAETTGDRASASDKAADCRTGISTGLSTGISTGVESSAPTVESTPPQPAAIALP